MSSARSRHPWQIRDVAFLAAALLAHAALLLLPLKSWHSAAPTTAPRLTINLQNPPQPRPPSEPPALKTAEEVSPPVEAQEPVSERLPERRIARIALEELPDQTDIDQTPAEPAEAEPEAPTLRQLREWIADSRLEKSATESERQLVAARNYQPPANWNRHAGAAFFADFDDRSHVITLPADVEIVDRWQAADGSHNVVVNLPDGEILCGRAAAYNPMQPLVEPVMMFTTCSKTPTFTIPARYKKGQ